MVMDMGNVMTIKGSISGLPSETERQMGATQMLFI